MPILQPAAQTLAGVGEFGVAQQAVLDRRADAAEIARHPVFLCPSSVRSLEMSLLTYPHLPRTATSGSLQKFENLEEI